MNTDLSWLGDIKTPPGPINMSWARQDGLSAGIRLSRYALRYSRRNVVGHMRNGRFAMARKVSGCRTNPGGCEFWFGERDNQQRINSSSAVTLILNEREVSKFVTRIQQQTIAPHKDQNDCMIYLSRGVTSQASPCLWAAFATQHIATSRLKGNDESSE